MRYQLRGISAAARGQLFPIVAERPIIVGRLQSSDIWIDDLTVSRRHCILMQTGEELVLHDEGSANGSYVNGIHVKRGVRRLQHRDVIQIGKVAFLVEEIPDVEADTPVFVASSVAE